MFGPYNNDGLEVRNVRAILITALLRCLISEILNDGGGFVGLWD